MVQRWSESDCPAYGMAAGTLKIHLVRLLKYWEIRERMIPKCMLSLLNLVFLISLHEDVEEEAPRINDRITSELTIESRRDFRNVPTFTIDPDDAKDFDDALSLQELPEEISGR